MAQHYYSEQIGPDEYIQIYNYLQYTGLNHNDSARAIALLGRAARDYSFNQLSDLLGATNNFRTAQENDNKHNDKKKIVKEVPDKNRAKQKSKEKFKPSKEAVAKALREFQKRKKAQKNNTNKEPKAPEKQKELLAKDSIMAGNIRYDF